MKRYCQTLKLRNDEELIRQYVKEHQNVWPEIKEGIKGIERLHSLGESKKRKELIIELYNKYNKHIFTILL